MKSSGRIFSMLRPDNMQSPHETNCDLHFLFAQSPAGILYIYSSFSVHNIRTINLMSVNGRLCTCVLASKWLIPIMVFYIHTKIITRQSD